ncbi:hypothetical protein U9M48_025163 [Paspalum notatum var. saurae]|uniref:Uncharacterized protein n=1 Tax=Paspalum notatum var. saurae TaxID=547442 RepID=A0AAQ3WWV4_PASNO
MGRTLGREEENRRKKEGVVWEMRTPWAQTQTKWKRPRVEYSVPDEWAHMTMDESFPRFAPPCSPLPPAPASPATAVPSSSAAVVAPCRRWDRLEPSRESVKAEARSATVVAAAALCCDAGSNHRLAEHDLTATT